jgi:DNA-binding SARP family transcriptional activator
LVGWLPEQASSLYATALEHRIHTDFVRTIIRRGGIGPPANSLPPYAWPLPLKVHTLGSFSVLIDERPLTFRGKSQKKPLELLKAVIAFGGRNVREERLIEALWPDAEGDAGARALTSALHRLRRLIGTEAVTRREGHLTLEARRCWVDLWSLERRLTELESDADGVRTSELVSRMREVVSLYRGAFLDGDPERAWMLSVRERLKGRMTSLLERFGECLIKAKDYEAALACFDRALQVDPTRESAYRGVMRVRTGQGERSEILAVYERCRVMLSSEFGCAPSVETEALLAGIGLGAGAQKTRGSRLTTQ